jgi:type III secretion protein Q
MNAPLAAFSAWQPGVLPAAASRLADRILRRRAPIALPGGWRVAPSLPLPTGALRGLDAAVAGQVVRIGLPPPVAAAWGAQVGDATLDALLLEHALAAHLLPFEQAFGAPVRFDRLRPDCPPLADAAVLGLSFDRGAERFSGSLSVPACLLGPLADALDRLPHAAELAPGLLLPLSLRIAMTRLSLATLATLAAGDALLPLHGPLPERRLVAVLGERLCWPAQQVAGAAPGQVAVAITGQVVSAHHAHQEWIMSDPAPTPTAADAMLDEIEVTLAFEVGRVTLSLAEIRALAPGRLLPLPPRAAPRVDVLAQGRRLGTGEIVRIGDELAVRLLAWNGA